MTRRLLGKIVGAFLLALIWGVFLSVDKAHAETSDWISRLPVVHEQISLPAELIPPSINGNRDCTKQHIVTRPAGFSALSLQYIPESSHESCVVNTDYGAVSQSGYMLLPGETVYGRIMFPTGYSDISILPIPRSRHAIYMTPNPPNGVKLFLVQDFGRNIHGLTNSVGEREYRLMSGYSAVPLRDKFANQVGVQLDSISFSNNGKWMVADVPFVGLVRVNTETFEMKVFGIAYRYNVGVTPAVQSAVSSNGRYVVVGSKSFTRLELYDLDNCLTDTICVRRDLWKFFKDTLPGFEGAARMRFASNYTIGLFTVVKTGDVQHIRRTVFTADSHEPVDFGYLGMGDSFASGEGAHHYKLLTDTDDNKCHLSLRSYPYLISAELGLDSAESVACMGALIKDLSTHGDNYKDPQAKGMSDPSYDSYIFGSFLPGYRPQVEYISRALPEVVTVSIFGNDIGFSDKIKRCLEPDTCYSTYEDRLEIIRSIHNQFGRLTELYTQISNEMVGKKVYAIGYPSIAKEDGNCHVNVRLNNDEIRFSNQFVRHLNKVIKAAADKVGVYFVDAETALHGHRLCENTHPNVAVNGMTAGNDIINVPFTDFDGPIGNESYHPNALGHELLKQHILRETADFSAPMAVAQTNSNLPQINDDLELLQFAPRSNRETYSVNYDDELGNDVAVRQGWWQGAIEASKVLLKQNSLFKVFINSEPLLLGEFEVTNPDDVTFSVQIPGSVPPGFHTIRVHGTTMSGQPVVVEKVVYVAASEIDFDGDGVVNNDDSCGFGEPSNTDDDQDGFDDGCGGIFMPAVVEEPPQQEETSPKPPENNPETVAGNEELVNQTLGENTTSITEAGAQSPPYDTGSVDKDPEPDTTSNLTQAVAGAQTTAYIQPPATPSQAESGIKSWLVPVVVFGTGGLLFIFWKVYLLVS